MTPYFSDYAPPKDLHEEALQKRIVDAVLELFEYTDTSAFSLPIPGTSPPLYVAAGEAETIALLVK